MGTLYRTFCPSCDGNAQTNVTFDGFVGAVITNSKLGGELVSDGYVAYLAENGDLVPLPHPLESASLETAGATWSDAANHGRLLYIHNLVCTDCGAQHTTASLHTGSAGCGVGLALGAAVIACDVLFFSFHPFIEIMLVWMALVAPSVLIDRYVRFRYRENALPHQTHRCSHCGGVHLVSLGSARKGPLPCPRCGKNTMTIEVAGRS